MSKLPKFQEPAETLPTSFVPDTTQMYSGTVIPDMSKMSPTEQFQYRQSSPFQSFIETINSEEGKIASQYSGNWYYSPTKDNSYSHWHFMRSEEPLQPMEQTIAEYMPYTGDVAEAGQIIQDFSQSNIGSGLLGAGLLVIPGNWGKIKNSLRNFLKRNNSPMENITEMLQNRANTPLQKRLQSGAVERVGYNGRLYKDTADDKLKVLHPKDYDPTVTIDPNRNTSASTVNNSPQESFINFNINDFNRKDWNNMQSIMSVYDHELVHLLDHLFRSNTTKWTDTSSWWPSVEKLKPMFNSWAKNIVESKNLDITSPEGQKLYESAISYFNEELYQYLSEATEQVARGVQIKDAAGITDGNRIFTPEEVKAMWENYRQESKKGNLLNNNMSQTYKVLKFSDKWKEYTDWFNKTVPAILPIGVGLTSSFVKNDNYKAEDNYE